MNRLGVLRLARAWQQSRSVILTYHGVLGGADDREDYLNHNFVAADAFERHLNYICHHYRPIALKDLVACYRRGVSPPRRSIAVTFDDGFANNCTVAFPMLKRRSIPFTVFLTTGMVDTPGAQLWSERVKRAIVLSPTTSVALTLGGRQIPCDLRTPAAREESARQVLTILKRQSPADRDASLASIEGVCGRPAIVDSERERYEFLTWAQVRAMAAEGVEFGSHTVSHPILSTVDEDARAVELAASKARIETELRTECYAFAYPNGGLGDFGVADKLALRKAGYSCALTLRGGLNGRRTDLYELDRVNIGRQFDPLTFEAKVAGVLGRAKRMRETLRGLTQGGQMVSTLPRNS